ncbi:MAG: hypothetical protein IJ391_02340 [Clostridia bacterium]|nr:hypothetical protein [Clostridia bacterium]
MATDLLLKGNSYFAAANSRAGFVSFFDKIFTQDELCYLYIIKGGSGTGKSRLMKEVGAEAEKLGEGVEYFYCSSDPDSLDGVILKNRGIGIIDGTSPHVAEPRLPGCFDEILNLGAFWDSGILRAHREEISLLCAEKSDLYQRAYSYLSVAGKLTSICDGMIKPHVRHTKLNMWAQRMCKRFDGSKAYTEKIRLTDGISYRGRTKLDSFYTSAREHYVISDTMHISHIVLQALCEAAKARGISHTVSYEPLDTSKINGLYLHDIGVSFTQLSYDKEPGAHDTLINTERFFDREAFKDDRSGVRSMNKCALLMTDAATETMKRIFSLHSALEDIYISAMDFKAKEEYTAALVKRIFLG